MKLLITRPAEDARRQAAPFEALGHEAVIRPLMEVVFARLTPLRLQGIQGLIATSRNALRGLARNGTFEAAKRLPVYCVGEGTAGLARELGFARVVPGNGAAKDLISVITYLTTPDAGALLYLTGQHLAFDLEKPLKAKGFAVPRVIIYEAREADKSAMAEFAQALRAGVDGIVLMSPRTAAICVKTIKQFKLQREAAAAACYCYSGAVARPLREFDGMTIAIACRPREADLLELVGPAAFEGEAAAELREAVAELRDALGKR
jgi:uroporphyrinogen-III synthase